MSSSKKNKRTRAFWDALSVHDDNSSVIDPEDKRGHKNRYIRELASEALKQVLRGVPENSLILDFGCGTGQNFPLLQKLGHRLVGVDISYPLLQRAQSIKSHHPECVIQYDGSQLPLASESIDAIISYNVLIYIPGDLEFVAILNELCRVLKRGGCFAAIEQTTKSDRFKDGGIKRQRPSSQYKELFEAGGFECRSARIIRRGHFPLVTAIRYGLVPRVAFPSIISMESALGRVMPLQIIDYADTLFVLYKR